MLEDERVARQEAARRVQGRAAETASAPSSLVRRAAVGGFLLSVLLSPVSVHGKGMPTTHVAASLSYRYSVFQFSGKEVRLR